VRPAVWLAIGLGVLAHATGTARPARADWEVRRSSDRALIEQAARALAGRPDDADLAARLARLAGKSGAAALRVRFERPARAADAGYAELAAYANILFALGAYEDAAAEFQRATAARSTVAALTGRARALERAGRRPEALAAFDDALARAERPAERRRILDAEAALVGPDAPERELAIRRALAALEPHSEDADARVVDVLERLGRPAEAAAVLEARGPEGGRSFERALRVAELRDAAGESERASEILTATVARLPRGDLERRRLAWTRALAVARHRDALPAFAETLARDAGPVEWEMLSQVRDELGDLEGALEAARRAAGARSRPGLARRIVTLLDRLGREDEVVSVYEDLARRAPDDPSWAIELVERELRRGRRKQAETHFDDATARFRGSPSAMLRLAELAARFGEDGRARTAWERVRRLAPHDEQGILGLGETQFAAGRRELAAKTWRALRDRGRGVEGRLRLAEVLLEHDLVAPALAEIEDARAKEPKQPRVVRLLAQALERQRQPEAAVRAWEQALALASDAGDGPLRHEARTRILALLARTSRARLDERVRTLEEQVRRAPGDRDTALFLAEAQQRLGNQSGAIATLRAVVDRQGAAATESGDDAAEVTFALVRLLRATGQIEEAVRRLEDLARRAPGRAREAHVQIADVELARHDESVALAHAEEAARLGARDGQALARIAAIQERAGDDERAFETYKRAFEGDADPTAGMALASFYERRGDLPAAAETLRRVLGTATDDEVIVDAGRRALDVEELLGRLPDFERLVARGLYSGDRAPAMRRLLVDVLRRLVPTLYHAPAPDEAARGLRARVSQHGLGVLLALLTDADVASDPNSIGLLGMLGNKDAAPALARLAAPATDPAADAPGADRAARATSDEVRVAAVIALGRIGDERGRDVLEKLAGAPEGRLRAAAVWALGRIAAPRDVPTFSRALRDARADVAGFACLGLGRTRSAQAVSLLTRVATDVARPLAVRRAAVAGLGASGSPMATTPLMGLTRSGDDDLTRTALLALAERRDPRALPLLLDGALLARGAARTAARLALDAWAGAEPPPDEALAIEGTRLDLEALINAREPHATGAARSIVWRGDARLVNAVLLSAMSDAAADRRLAALEALADEAQAAAIAIEAATNDAVTERLDDQVGAVRAAALRVLARSSDARATAERVARAAAGGPEERAAAAEVARRWAETSPALAAGLAKALSKDLSATSAHPWADRGGDGGWQARLGLVSTLAVLGAPGQAGLRSALSDPSALVRAAAGAALEAPARPRPPGP
jgi:tetratricopeptide (TPR) repeat protein/HEAT repeat protein